MPNNNSQRVTTYALAYLTNATVRLCEACDTANDHEYVLGPVLVGLHEGRCQSMRCIEARADAEIAAGRTPPRGDW